MGSPLVYLFWHRRRADAGRAQYEEALGGFHRALRRRPPPGLLAASALRTNRTPWAPVGKGDLYEDVYCLDDFGRLGSIVQVAYRPPWAEPHREIARQSDSGTSALYVNRAGPFPPPPAEAAAWLQAPSRDALARVGCRVDRLGGSLWQRHLALGPSPEFVVRGPAGLANDAEIRRSVRPAPWLRYELIADGKAGEGKGWSGRASSSRPSRTRSRSRQAPWARASTGS